jgi:hypothetical protein
MPWGRAGRGAAAGLKRKPKESQKKTKKLQKKLPKVAKNCQ